MLPLTDTFIVAPLFMELTLEVIAAAQATGAVRAAEQKGKSLSCLHGRDSNNADRRCSILFK
jgi:hypothetical protein